MITDRELIVNDHHGIYAGQQAAQALDLKAWGLGPEDIKALEEGPEHEDYDWACSILEDLERVDEQGREWRLAWDEGSLWAVTEWIPDHCEVRTFPTWILPALVNDDWSGLDEDEEQGLRSWIRDQGPHFEVLDTDEETFFSKYHDGPGLGGECADCVCSVRCQACNDRGYLNAWNSDLNKKEIQRCDACEKFKSDDEALAHRRAEQGLVSG